MEETVLLCNSKFCRLCAEGNDNGIDIFTPDENSTNIQQVINKYLPIVVQKDDKFPKNICPGCHIQLEATKYFMDLLINGQTILREMYKKQQAKQNKLKQIEENLQGLQDEFIYTDHHQLKLLVEGLDRPKRKRGRPAKKVVTEEQLVSQDEVIEEIEQTREIEQNVDEFGIDGRKKRKIRVPQRFVDVIQGKELEDVLKKEGVLDEELKVESTRTEERKNIFSEVIGRIEGTGDDLNKPVFINRNLIKSRIDSLKQSQIKKLQCQICSKIFINEITFNNHMKHHESENIIFSQLGDARIEFSIEQSSESFDTAADTTDNIISNKLSSETTQKSEELKIECSKCSKCFPSKEILKIHMEEHSQTKKYPCDICGKVFLHQSSLLYHKATDHNKERFVCNKCDKSFKHKQLLQRHQIVHSDERPFVCPVCNMRFKTSANLMNHEAVHTGEKKFECQQCSQKFIHKTSLSLHQRWHEGKKPYTCEFCQKSFSQNGNLLEHKRIHTGEKPFFCEMCGKRFTTSSQFKIHVKRHTGEKPWKCELCSSSFLHKENYKLHLNRHLNHRPYQCSICKKCFTDLSSLKKHSKVHTGEKPFKCEYCPKSFADKSNQLKHSKLHILKNATENSDDRFQLTQLVDQHGNPISVTTQDGQTVTVVTSGDDDSNIQGLLPDGTLVPIDISVQDKEYSMEEPLYATLAFLENSDTISSSDGIIENLNSNFQLLGNNAKEEVCLVTYSIEEDGALTQELGSE